MTAMNITDNDLTNPEAETRRQVTAYNDNVGEMLDGVFGGTIDAVERRSRNLIEDLGGTIVGYWDVPEWDDPANDNEPVQLDLFGDLPR